ncbi:hypothetical protein [Lysobacter gummosus]|uniref:hypothetical protein n=1 Tax=Lysobacter gummosus TaxID=262324 RepID=UPI00363EEF08
MHQRKPWRVEPSPRRAADKNKRLRMSRLKASVSVISPRQPAPRLCRVEFGIRLAGLSAHSIPAVRMTTVSRGCPLTRSGGP